MHAEPKQKPEEETVPPGDDSNTDPTPPLPADPGRNDAERHAAAANGQKLQPPMDDEPELNNSERDIPSDGRDREGERMIQDLDKPTEPAGDKDKPTGHDHGH